MDPKGTTTAGNDRIKHKTRHRHFNQCWCLVYFKQAEFKQDIKGSFNVCLIMEEVPFPK